MSDIRLEQLTHWLRQKLATQNLVITPASGDASFRRYFRVQHDDATLIAMDAPPDRENSHPFVHVAEKFGALGLNVPKILHLDLSQGFMVLNDFGTTQYLDVLNDSTVEDLYGDAMGALVHLQKGSRDKPEEFPPYDHALLWREMELFREWFSQRHLGIEFNDGMHRQLDDIFETLAVSALAQPKAWVHRDYHSRNLMVVDENNPGILDFQDAVVGPVTYDLVSLLRDCYIAWPLPRVEAWVEAFRQQLHQQGVLDNVGTQQFMKWFDLMGVQRHLKAIGIFCRLNYRDNKPGYLKDIPRTLNYVMEVSVRYPELAVLNAFILDHVLPRFDMSTGGIK